MVVRFGAALLAAVAAPALAIPADYKAQADAILAAVPADAPGVAVVVSERGRIVYQAGRGLADVEARTPITPTTVFRLGSITKQFTAAAIMKLVEQGKVSLDDPLTDYVPAYPQPGGAATVRQLLNHTSGIMPYTAIPGFMVDGRTGRAYTTEQLVATFRDLPVQFAPGAKYTYNNSGYVLLGAILEKVTGKSWDAAVGDLVIAPLGLAIRGGLAESGTRSMARGYTVTGGKVAPAAPIHMTAPHAAGALIGTVGDLARWADALHKGKVVSPASYAAMTGTVTTADGQTEPYGFGLATYDVRGRKAIGHSGGINGFSTDSFYLPGSDLFVAVFTNSDSGPSTGTLSRRLAAAAIGDPYASFTAVPADPATVEPLLGRYKVATGERRFYRRDGKLYTRRDGAGELEVFAAGNNRFFYGPDNLTWFEVAAAADGSRVMRMYQNGAVKAEDAAWLGPIPPEAPSAIVPAAILDSYVGTYASPIGTFLIGRDGDRLTVKLNDQQAFPMRAASATDFEIAPVNAVIKFTPATSGKADMLTLHQNGQQMPAKRIK